MTSSNSCPHDYIVSGPNYPMYGPNLLNVNVTAIMEPTKCTLCNDANFKLVKGDKKYDK